MDKRQGTTKHGPGLVDVLVLLGFCTVIGLAGFGIFFGGRAVVERIEAEFDARVATRVAAGVEAEIQSRLTLTQKEIREYRQGFREWLGLGADPCWRQAEEEGRSSSAYKNCIQFEFDRHLGVELLDRLGLPDYAVAALVYPRSASCR